MASTDARGGMPRMTLPRALRSELLRLTRSPLAAAHLACGIAGGVACGAYFSVASWDPALGTDAYAQFLGALMPLMSGISCGLAADEERGAGRLANLTAVPSRGRAALGMWLALALMGAGALAVALGTFGGILAASGRLSLGVAPLLRTWAGLPWGASRSTRSSSRARCSSGATPRSGRARRERSSRSSRWAGSRTAS